ncbi:MULTISPECIES: outer membrane protein [Aureimonas]|uniref:Outer membrane protein beta-barrel domain-containing protein n=1 Tax=Aureimonas ureilytica TaxID=401562 RepID=A0A175RBA3_9HYPH|nr:MULTISPECIES: outer membrane protein [Aureimonas]KTQ96605.1 hypothetical protein NS226_07385 [Aureimonas ureilytica]
MKLKTLLLFGTAVLLSSAASAADLGPIYREAPELVPVEIGTGWYLRGDVGYNFRGDAIDRRFPSFMGAAGPAVKFDDSNDVSGSVGMGYQFNDFLRADATFDYMPSGDRNGSAFYGCGVLKDITTNGQLSTINTTGVCRDNASAEADLYTYMANAYVDLGTVVGFTPYVGAGLGVTNLRASMRETLHCNEGGDPTVDCSASFAGAQKGLPYELVASDRESSSWNLSYALMAGLGYSVSQNLKLDVGYRYFAVPDAELFGQKNEKMDFHQVRVGLRYALW